MSKRAWFSLGLAIGIDLIVLLDHGLSLLEARAKQYVRAPASTRVVRLTGRKPE